MISPQKNDRDIQTDGWADRRTEGQAYRQKEDWVERRSEMSDHVFRYLRMRRETKKNLRFSQ